jgi:hypothetical protein
MAPRAYARTEMPTGTSVGSTLTSGCAVSAATAGQAAAASATARPDAKIWFGRKQPRCSARR